ncbi:MAG TPA: asparagine synthase (glutamine-hydrolyzing) [Hyphomicrobiaceae bacterium]|nr:asparagine synthase (glutamine-hydrolyzing) [Hyphomicrobiaceae bacterium]
MCAICGWLFTDPGHLQSLHLQQLLQSMHHRGPDDSGIFIDKEVGVALGHNRLSIIDLSPGGHQPMVNPNNGDVLVFNGEIYNFRELRTELEGRGVRFKSQSDSEVLLMAFEQWGADCVRHIRGMFSFAIWQMKENALYLFRDPAGIKPLYYWCPPWGGLVFASEVKAFLQIPGFPARLDGRALQQFLEFGYCFEPSQSIFEGVCRLPPGHFLRLKAGAQPQLKDYFAPDLCQDLKESKESLEEALFETLRIVVRQHLRADVPVGLLLSGGIDSSLLAALAAQNGDIRTISMGFAQSKIDERPAASAVASFIGSNHEEVLIAPEEIINTLSETIPYFDDLFADWGTISTRLLYRKCRERGIKVVLVGEGADELFGGYDIFRQSFSSAPTEWWLFQLYRRYAGQRHGRCYKAFRQIMREHLDATKNDRFAAMRLFESRNQLPGNYVMKVDKASMSVSVEARVPFLDQRVLEVAYRIPRAQLLSRDNEKQILRNIASHNRLLPSQTINQRKFGASMAASWMDESPTFRNFAQEKILDSGSWTTALGLHHAMHQYFFQNRRGYSMPHAISIFRNLAWRLLILEMWSKSYSLSPNLGGKSL